MPGQALGRVQAAANDDDVRSVLRQIQGHFVHAPLHRTNPRRFTASSYTLGIIPRGTLTYHHREEINRCSASAVGVPV